jgi:hypothetical protein
MQTRARAANRENGVVFDPGPAFCELDPRRNVLRKVAAAGEERSMGAAA